MALHRCLDNSLCEQHLHNSVKKDMRSLFFPGNLQIKSEEWLPRFLGRQPGEKSTEVLLKSTPWRHRKEKEMPCSVLPWGCSFAPCLEQSSHRGGCGTQKKLQKGCHKTQRWSPAPASLPSAVSLQIWLFETSQQAAEVNVAQPRDTKWHGCPNVCTFQALPDTTIKSWIAIGTNQEQLDLLCCSSVVAPTIQTQMFIIKQFITILNIKGQVHYWCDQRSCTEALEWSQIYPSGYSCTDRIKVLKKASFNFFSVWLNWCGREQSHYSSAALHLFSWSFQSSFCKLKTFSCCCFNTHLSLQTLSWKNQPVPIPW